jgi:pimeloyl-ACP methyl ester carboxylesterase
MMIHDPARIDALAVTVQNIIARQDRVKGRSLVRTGIMLELAKRWTATAYGIWGRQDTLYVNDFGKLENAVSKLGMKEAVFLDDSGHWLPFERAEYFNEFLARVLSEEEA